MYLLPSENLAIVGLMNTRKQERDWFNGQLTDRVAVEVVDAFVPGFKARMAERHTARQAADNAYTPSEAYLGEWEGTLHDYSGETMKAVMLFQEDGDIHITLGRQFTALVQSAQLREGLLWGQFPSWVPTDVSYEWDHLIQLRMRFKEGEAHGYLMSNFRTDNGVFGLPSYMHLERK